jgi:hypothetical protein
MRITASKPTPGRSQRPPARRTFGARPLTRLALILLVSGVVLAALAGRLAHRESSTGPARPAVTAPAASPTEPALSPSPAATSEESRSTGLFRAPKSSLSG